MTDFRGARGSNAGDAFHELWATRQAMRLLLNEEGLEAIAVEGLSSRDEVGKSPDTWDGVDCTLYFGGRDANKADKIQIEQLKYSAANPNKSWTVARLSGGERRDRSVIARLAKAWRGLAASRPIDSPPHVVLVSNQPVDPEVPSAMRRAAGSLLTIPTCRPRATAIPEIRLAYAAGLNANDFRLFAANFSFETGTDSRFGLEEQVLRTMAEWTDLDIQGAIMRLREFVRQRMMPESAGKLITRELVLLHFGASDEGALFPCRSEIKSTENPVSRASVQEATTLLQSGVQYLCLHGSAGVGKTTALQELDAALPADSITVKYDCYGGGRYLDPSALRHRTQDAFLQLTNELAAHLKLPLLLSRRQDSDYPRLFVNRLRHASEALNAKNSSALIVITIDAADNAVYAAQSRNPVEPSFVHDFLQLTDQSMNVRFIVTARTGRLELLQLPRAYHRMEIEPFSRLETGKNVARVWPAPKSWVDDFHHFSRGIPRVQAYAFEADDTHPSTALNRLMPRGKSLREIFRKQFDDASRKSGNPAEVELLCAGLIALPRPVPLSDLAAVLNSTEAQLSDVCVDLSPGIRLQNDTVSFADEDFEDFVRTEGEGELSDVRGRAAERLLSRADNDHYAALNVAEALVAAGRGSDLLTLVENELVPHAVEDPVLRREAELRRLRLALKVCRKAGDIVRALRFVLIGAEGIKTETALRRLLAKNPDLTARFAYETAGRLILSDADHIEDHGPLLFQKLAVDADRADAISVREGWRFLQAWLDARNHSYQDNDNRRHHPWNISISDISSTVEAAFKLDGPTASLEALRRWAPKRIALEVALALPYRLIAEGHGSAIETLVTEDYLDPLSSLFLLIPLALAGHSVNADQMVCGLEQLMRRKLHVKRFFEGRNDGQPLHGQIINVALTACELLTVKKKGNEVVDKLLSICLGSELRRIDRCRARETLKLDILFRAYALREVREGRIPTAEGVFEPRPKSTGKDKRHQEHWKAERERELKELAGAVFGVYAAVAGTLVNQRTDFQLEKELRHVCSALGQEEWRISRQLGGGALRDCAAKNLTTLLAAGYEPEMIRRFAINIHDLWRSGHEVPNGPLITRLSLWPQLHNFLVEYLASSSEETRKMRIGAREKSEILVGYARCMKPLNEADANEIFNYAIDAAGELDQEILAQITLLDQLVKHSNQRFADARNTAQLFSNIVADAAIRLDDHRYFPWDEAMSALARLDAPLALANVARWDDEGVATVWETLSPVLKTALGEGTIRPGQAAALTMLSDDNSDVMAEVLKRWKHTEHRSFSSLIEEAAYDILIRKQHFSCGEAIQRIAQTRPRRRWTDALIRQMQFVETLPPEPITNHKDTFHTDAKVEDPLSTNTWTRETLIDSSMLQDVAQKLSRSHAQAGREFLPLRAVFESARKAVPPGDRIRHLEALAGIEGFQITKEAVDALLEAVDEWWISPSIKVWCKINLPDIVVARLPELTRYIVYGEDYFTPVLKRIGFSDLELQKMILRGLERHVDAFNSELIFKLAGMIGCKLAPSDAARLADWYVRRLAERIPANDRDQTASPCAIPCEIDGAVARFLFAYMGDCDLRLRWRAAHAVRRLARTGEEATLRALIGEYDRREETVFRGRNFAFYWLAARLWFVLTWDRIVGETPDQARNAACTLLRIALDDSFPHLLVRSFARNACEKLVAAGQLSLTGAEYDHLKNVNETPLARNPVTRKGGVFGSYFFSHRDRDESRRFHFDLGDTLPYWYVPMLRSFANVDGECFLQKAERWIIDVWGYSDNTLDWNKERQRGRFRNGDWSLRTNRHGSMPTLEHLQTHLEWHAMWCAAGELLKTEPLAALGQDYRDELSDRISGEKLVEPPLWSADLRVSTPLEVRNWRPDTQALDGWISRVEEAIYRTAIFPGDSCEYIVVDGSSERRSGDRSERTDICSALVEPATGRSLLRALQTMDDTWDYKVPDEGEDRAEIDEGPYRFLGWLVHPSRDSGIDEKDPLRAYGLIIHCRPGKRLRDACHLRRDEAGRPCWFSGRTQHPMFVYESWGEPEKHDERYTPHFTVSGHRLLAHKAQLLNFLHDQELDLIIEVEVRRHGGKNRRYDREERHENPEGKFARLYRLDSRGGLEIAERRLGTWTGDSSTA